MSRIGKLCEFLGKNKYAVFVLIMCTLAYLMNQLAAFSLIATNLGASQDLEYGDRVCDVKNQTAVNVILTSHDVNQSGSDYCSEHQGLCDDLEDVATECPGCCYWRYLGRGLQYQLLAGPLYIVLYAISGIPMGLICELGNINRKVCLGICVIGWSIMTVLGALTQEYWHLAVTRILLGVFSAGAVPFSCSIISDYFSKESRGAAMGFYNWGIYTGFSLTFLLLMAERSLGWRPVYWIVGVPGIVLGVVILIAVKEPARGEADENKSEKALDKVSGMLSKLKEALRCFIRPSLLLLCLGGAIRNGAGIVIAYNFVLFYGEYHPEVRTEEWLSWIPLIFGSLGALSGGYISDILAKRRGVTGRFVLLIACLAISAPFLVGMLYAPMPWSFISLIPGYFFGEMWIGVCLAVVVDLVPADLTTSSIAVYIFIIMMIGGNMNLLVTPLTDALNLRTALLITYPGLYVLGGAIFVVAMLVVRWEEARGKGKYQVTSTEENGKEKPSSPVQNGGENGVARRKEYGSTHLLEDTDATNNVSV